MMWKARRAPVSEADLAGLYLGELPPARERVVRRALARSPALKAEADAIGSTLAALSGAFAEEEASRQPASDLDRAWARVRPSLARYPAAYPAMAPWRRPLMAGAVLASVALLAVLFAGRFHGHRQTGEPQAAARAGSSPAPGGTAAPDTRAAATPDDVFRLPHSNGGVFHPAGRRPWSAIRPLELARVRSHGSSVGLAPPFFVPEGVLTGPRTEPLGMTPQGGSAGVGVNSANSPASDRPSPGPVQAAQLPRASGRGQGHPGAIHASWFNGTISLGAGGQVTAGQLEGSKIDPGTQNMDATVVILGTVRQSFRPWAGYSLNLGYARTTERNTGSAATYSSSFPVPVNQYEVSLSYLAQKQLKPRWTASAQVGGGVLTYLPVHRGSTAVNFVPRGNPAYVPGVDLRPAGVAGIGVEYHLTAKVAVRAEYRALLFKYPAFGELEGKNLTVSQQPVFSVTYHLGSRF